MDLSGRYTFSASPEIVWNLLNDPEVIASCLPGCDRLELIAEDRYRAVLNLAVAAVGGQYTATVAILDKRPPHAYRLAIDGAGKPGFVKGEATIELAAENHTTVVSVKGQAHVGGLVARVGQRLLTTVSNTLMEKFFGCLQARAAKSS